MQVKPLILAVDDERDVTELLRHALTRAEYEVITATNGDEALDLVAQRKPDLVLLDIRMPGKSGREVLQELRINYPDTAVVMATAITDTSVAIKALTDGAYDYLCKPFSVSELTLTVERALDRRRLLLENREYRLNLERKVSEQTQALQQRIRELTALNDLFTRYLNQGFEMTDRYVHLTGEILKMCEEMQSSGNTDICINLAGSISKKVKEIQSLAKEFQFARIGVQAASGKKTQD